MLDSEGERISLAASNVIYIKKDGVDLVPNTDSTLWVNETSANGEYTFEVKTIDGNVYIAILNWTESVPEV